MWAADLGLHVCLNDYPLIWFMVSNANYPHILLLEAKWNLVNIDLKMFCYVEHSEFKITSRVALPSFIHIEKNRNNKLSPLTEK